jgi:ppGpp synthetase/RelA/SpoT-type nucleotidyltranferase
VISREHEVRTKYADRVRLLSTLARTLEEEVATYLQGVAHVDRIYFRVKDVESLVRKATTAGEDHPWKYPHPLEEIEDQVAGRVLVFYRSDVPEVVSALTAKLRKAEKQLKQPAQANQFDYETTHLVFMITPDLRPAGWEALEEPVQTFEVQVRTLAQHAWAEPQHGFYKAGAGLSPESLRKLYWAAASAWGLDSIWEELRRELETLNE